MNVIYTLTEENLLQYLDLAIGRWRAIRDSSTETDEYKTMATCYIDAFQSVRMSFFGTTKPPEEGYHAKQDI